MPLSRNAVDITIEQTINRHAKSQGGIIGFNRNYAAYYRWCVTLFLADMYLDELRAQRVAACPNQKQETGTSRVKDAIVSFTNPFAVEN